MDTEAIDYKARFRPHFRREQQYPTPYLLQVLSGFEGTKAEPFCASAHLSTAGLAPRLGGGKPIADQQLVREAALPLLAPAE